jgi:membrane-associated phospholipid phosphatase
MKPEFISLIPSYLKTMGRHCLTPIFWLSLFFLGCLMLVNLYFGLPIRSFDTIKGMQALTLNLLFFILFFYFYHAVFSLNKCTGVVVIIKKTFISTLKFFLRVLPFFIFLYIYDSIHDVTHLINSGEYDAGLIKLDQWLLFGRDIALVLERLINPGLTGWMAISYISYFLFYFIGPVFYFLYAKGRFFDLVLGAIILTNFLGLLGYIAVPCVGPLLAQKNLFTQQLVMPSGEIYLSSGDLAAAYVNNRGSFHCFPSLHFGVTFVWLYYAWKLLRKHKWLKYFYYFHWLVFLPLWFSTLYLRWHYVSDLIGGLIVAMLGITLANWLIKIKETS